MSVQPQPGRGGRVAVIDPEAMIRMALPILLPDFQVVATLADHRELMIGPDMVDLVVIEPRYLNTPHDGDSASWQAVRTLAEAGHRVCVHTGSVSRHTLVGHIHAGAMGIADKTDPIEVLRATVAAVCRGERAAYGKASGLFEFAARSAPAPPLTGRQREVLAGRARGEKFEVISQRLFITTKVAQEHWAIVQRKHARFLSGHSPADLERFLGLTPRDLFDRLAV